MCVCVCIYMVMYHVTMFWSISRTHTVVVSYNSNGDEKARDILAFVAQFLLCGDTGVTYCTASRLVEVQHLRLYCSSRLYCLDLLNISYDVRTS